MNIQIFGFGNTVNINASDFEDDLEDDLEEEQSEDISELKPLSYAVYKIIGCPLGNTTVGFKAWLDKGSTEYYDFCDGDDD